MTFNLAIGDGRGGAIDLNFGRHGLDSVDFVQGYRTYGNGPYGASGYSSVGIGRDGLHAGGGSAQWGPDGMSTRDWRQNAYGYSERDSSYNAWSGNYQNHAYARDVFGGYRDSTSGGNVYNGNYGRSEVAGNAYTGNWGRSDVGGNYYTGAQGWRQSGGDGWGNGYSVGGNNYSVPYYSQNYYAGCGGGQVNAWYGGGCGRHCW